MLVQPLYKPSPVIERIIEFKGLNKKAVVEEGELRNMKNMTSDEYPCLYQRKARGIFKMPEIVRPISMISKSEKLALIAEKEISDERIIAFYFNNEEIPKVKNLTEDTKMVSINSKICFFPQKIFYDIETHEIGSLEANISFSGGTLTKISDGQKIVFSEESSEPFDDFWVGDAINFTAHMQIAKEGEEEPFEKDVVVSALIQDKGIDESTNLPYIVFPDNTFIELSEEGVTEASLTNINMNKECPDLDYVMEYNNRLWGVSNADNTIYACKLGDPRNWQYFQNTSLDSYYAEQGTDGEWTGLAPYSGHMLFFKEKYIHKVYGTAPSNYQIVTATAHGIEIGSSKSVAIINDVVLYKSKLGIMAYEGGQPYLITEKFGSAKFKNVVAGTNGIKYYASIIRENEDGTEEPIMVVCDFDRGLWHKEDGTRAKDFCMLKNDLLFINENKVDYFNKDTIYIINAENPMEQETKINWMVEIGPFDEYIENKKIYSKMAMRLEVEDYTELDIYISIDEGEWEQLEHVSNYKNKVLPVPIVPRRCNKFSIKLEGIGRCRIDSISRKYRMGTGGML